MVNAIDEQHFRGVHRLPGEILTMQPHEKAHYRIAFPNEGKMPRTHWLGRVLARFYKDRFTYRLSYWYGSNGMITFVPEFLHLMFALRLTEKGKTEGRTLVFTRRRRGVFGRIFNRAALAFIHHREQQESFAVAAEN